jgi:hypothetical protein
MSNNNTTQSNLGSQNRLSSINSSVSSNSNEPLNNNKKFNNVEIITNEPFNNTNRVKLKIKNYRSNLVPNLPNNSNIETETIQENKNFAKIKEMKNEYREKRQPDINHIKTKLQEENPVFTKEDFQLINLFLKPEKRYLVDLLYNPIPLQNSQNLGEIPTENTVHWGPNDYGYTDDEKSRFLINLRKKENKDKKFKNFIKNYLLAFLDPIYPISPRNRPENIPEEQEYIQKMNNRQKIKSLYFIDSDTNETIYDRRIFVYGERKRVEKFKPFTEYFRCLEFPEESILEGDLIQQTMISTKLQLQCAVQNNKNILFPIMIVLEKNRFPYRFIKYSQEKINKMTYLGMIEISYVDQDGNNRNINVFNYYDNSLKKFVLLNEYGLEVETGGHYFPKYNYLYVIMQLLFVDFEGKDPSLLMNLYRYIPTGTQNNKNKYNNLLEEKEIGLSNSDIFFVCKRENAESIPEELQRNLEQVKVEIYGEVMNILSKHTSRMHSFITLDEPKYIENSLMKPDNYIV